ncbi:hypothetical protein O8W32_05585 [Methanomassiliicoccales archaeon LGM-DZ1]|nr:hypothetical protein O8W32_05585 [Methanomassiliicoccales archaeon LGM-DZ1]
MSAASAEDGARWFLAFFGLVAGILCLAASAMSFAGGDAGLGAVFAAVCIACFLLAFLLRRSLRRGFGRGPFPPGRRPMCRGRR